MIQSMPVCITGQFWLLGQQISAKLSLSETQSPSPQPYPDTPPPAEAVSTSSTWHPDFLFYPQPQYSVS